MDFIVFVAVVALGAVGLRYAGVKREIVLENQRALLFRNGTLDRELGSGAYWIWTGRDHIVCYDLRPRQIEVPGQEILTQDRAAVKISLLLTLRFTDPRVAYNAAIDSQSAIYAATQIALRDAVADRTIDGILENRHEVAAAMRPAVEQAAERLGAEIEDVAVRDIMLPTALKKGYLAVEEARLEASRQLETARGEAAVLRSLANSAKLMEATPGLYRARLLQELSSGRHTIVLGDMHSAIAGSEI